MAIPAEKLIINLAVAEWWLRRSVEKLDHAGLKTILGADDQQTVALDQALEQSGAMA